VQAKAVKNLATSASRGESLKAPSLQVKLDAAVVKSSVRCRGYWAGFRWIGLLSEVY
jgi:hypothetical protein